MGIAKFIVRRLLYGVLTLFIISIVVFLLTQLLGDPARAILGRESTPASLAAKREELGLNRPLIEQYLDWLFGLLSGDLGTSYTNGLPIWDFLGERVINSLFMVACTSIVVMPIALTVGAYSALRRDKFFDNTSTTTTLVFASLPEFVTGTLLISLLATNVWHIFPAVSEVRGDVRPWNDLDGMVLPVLTLTLSAVPYIVRSTRASMVEVLESDYVEMAKLKGLSPRTVLWRHAMPNAIGPTFQVLALSLAYLAAGVVIVDTIFNYPGIGSALIEAILPHNVPVVQFLAMLLAAIYVLCNLAADIATVLVTPRLRTRLT